MATSPRNPGSLRSFAAVDRFVAEIATPSLRPGYVLIGDEIYLYDRCRRAVLSALVPEGFRDFSLHDIDLGETTIFDALDRAQTPSLMAPFQVLFIRNVKSLYGRGSKKEEFAAIEAYFRSPNPQALLVFVADHLRIPTDVFGVRLGFAIADGRAHQGRASGIQQRVDETSAVPTAAGAFHIEHRIDIDICCKQRVDNLHARYRWS